MLGPGFLTLNATLILLHNILLPRFKELLGTDNPDQMRAALGYFALTTFGFTLGRLSG